MTRRTLLNDPCEARNEDREPTPLRSGLAFGSRGRSDRGGRVLGPSWIGSPGLTRQGYTHIRS